MNAEEIQIYSQSIAFHPLVAIGSLMILIFIARRNDIKHKISIKRNQELEQSLSDPILNPVSEEQIDYPCVESISTEE